MSTAGLVHGQPVSPGTSFGIADSGAKHAATQGERYRFKGDTTDWFAFPHALHTTHLVLFTINLYVPP